MSFNNTPAASCAPQTAEAGRLIVNELARWHANQDGVETANPGVMLYRAIYLLPEFCTLFAHASACD